MSDLAGIYVDEASYLGQAVDNNDRILAAAVNTKRILNSTLKHTSLTSSMYSAEETDLPKSASWSG